MEGFAGIGVELAAIEVEVGEENLGDVKVVLGEGCFVVAHEERLPDGGAGLEVFDDGGAFFEAEGGHACADGTGGDEDGVDGECAFEDGELASDVGDLCEVKLAIG